MPTSHALPTTSFLDPAILARIGNLELLARVVVEGFINGLHRSPHLGASTDFAEHRAYMPGDDIRRIDWRLFARSDRHYVKEFEADTNTNAMVLLDVSPSMHYRGPSAGDTGVTKLQYACYLAAALSYFSSTQRDRVGLATFDRDLVDYVPPAAKHLQLVLHSLERTGASPAGAPPADRGGPARLLHPLRKLSESLRRRSIVILISDFYEEPDDVINAASFLRGRGNDVILFHVLDRDERQFPFPDASNFVDLESGERMPVVPEYLRRQYRELVAAHVAELERRTREQRMDYAMFDTSQPLDRALFDYLLARQRFTRVR
jgi:uncharacterized protein (DUF58 family)